MKPCIILTFLVSVGLSQAAIKISSSGRTFSNAEKGATLFAFVETSLFQMVDGPGYVTQQWFTGPGLARHSRIKIYIDGEKDPSLDFDMYMGHGIGKCDLQESKAEAWGTRRIGHLANMGGLYNNIRIPFSKSINVTATSPVGGDYWYIIRGVLGLPLEVGGYELPAGARLRLYNIDDRTLEPFEFVKAAEVANKAGWVYQVTLSAKSTNFQYLEACFRLYVDNEKEQFLSSGTEDFFLSAYYYNKQRYHTDSAGLTCLNKTGTAMMSAYKFFEDDPIFFRRSMKLLWRCGEEQGSVHGCPNAYQRLHPGLNAWHPQETTISLYVWVYEYDL